MCCVCVCVCTSRVSLLARYRASSQDHLCVCISMLVLCVWTNIAYLLVAREADVEHFAKLGEVGLHLGLKEAVWDVTHVDHAARLGLAALGALCCRCGAQC